MEICSEIQKGRNGNRTRVPDVRELLNSLAIIHDRSNSAIFQHLGLSRFHKFSPFSINDLSKTGQ